VTVRALGWVPIALCLGLDTIALLSGIAFADPQSPLAALPLFALWGLGSGLAAGLLAWLFEGPKVRRLPESVATALLFTVALAATFVVGVTWKGALLDAGMERSDAVALTWVAAGAAHAFAIVHYRRRLVAPHAPSTRPPPGAPRLTVLYDAACPFCVGCMEWMENQPAHVHLRFLPSDSPEARRRFGALPWLGRELCVVGERGEIWVGPAAFLLCMWALVRWRDWAERLASGALAPVAGWFFALLSRERRHLAFWFGHAACTGGRCGAARSVYR
jgi:predicted DCC family thiol-disulfide oxidoreductase YuxK